jgi:hypothetical protein
MGEPGSPGNYQPPILLLFGEHDNLDAAPRVQIPATLNHCTTDKMGRMRSVADSLHAGLCGQRQSCIVHKGGSQAKFSAHFVQHGPIALESRTGEPIISGLGSRKAGVAQLVEHDVANVVVVGSNPITRSFYSLTPSIHGDDHA